MKQKLQKICEWCLGPNLKTHTLARKCSRCCSPRGNKEAFEIGIVRGSHDTANMIFDCLDEAQRECEYCKKDFIVFDYDEFQKIKKLALSLREKKSKKQVMKNE